MTCPDCEYHKRRAQIWRHQAYKLGGKPLPWEPWVGLTDEENREFEIWLDADEEKHGWNPPAGIVKYLETKFKEKNGF